MGNQIETFPNNRLENIITPEAIDVEAQIKQ